MKSHKAIRMRMVMLGLGTTLLLAASARGQQDVDPTYFDVKPGAPQVQRQAAAPAAAQFSAAEQTQMQQQAAGVSGMADATLEANLVRLTATDTMAAAILFGGVVLIVMYAQAATKRERRSNIGVPRSPASGAATS